MVIFVFGPLQIMKILFTIVWANGPKVLDRKVTVCMWQQGVMIFRSSLIQMVTAMECWSDLWLQSTTLLLAKVLQCVLVLFLFIETLFLFVLFFQHIALAGEDMEVKLIDLEKREQKTVIFDGAKGPYLSVALCPFFQFMAASSGDGTLRVWNVKSNALVKEVECFKKVNSFANATALCMFLVNQCNILNKNIFRSHFIRSSNWKTAGLPSQKFCCSYEHI